MVYRGVNSPIKTSPSLWLVPFKHPPPPNPQNDDFKLPSHLFAPPNLIVMTTTTRHLT